MVPARGAGEPARMDVGIDPDARLVTDIVAHTRSGDFTRYRISETLFGPPTSPSDFEITVPPGAERIGGGRRALR